MQVVAESVPAQGMREPYPSPLLLSDPPRTSGALSFVQAGQKADASRHQKRLKQGALAVLQQLTADFIDRAGPQLLSSQLPSKTGAAGSPGKLIGSHIKLSASCCLGPHFALELTSHAKQSCAIYPACLPPSAEFLLRFALSPAQAALYPLFLKCIMADRRSLMRDYSLLKKVWQIKRPCSMSDGGPCALCLRPRPGAADRW